MKRLLLLPGCIVLAACATSGMPEHNGTDPVMRRLAEVNIALGATVERDGVTAALERARTLIHEEPALTGVCHGIVHEIGHAAYAVHGFEDAMRFEDDLCGSGYIHGVIETHFASLEEIDTELHTLCEPNEAKCFHGVGHGLMYWSANDLPWSLSKCDALPERAQQIQCSEGVFMENYGADGVIHETEYLREEDPFFPCRNQRDIYEGTCALYAPRYYVRLHPKQYREAMQWCVDTVPPGPLDACIKGVGDVTVKENILHPEFALDVCDSAPEDKRHYCIQGVVSYTIVHYARSSKGQELCDTLSGKNRESCQKVVNDNKKYYPE